MELRLQIVSIGATLALFLLVFELVRRRRLMERYALLWLFSTVVLLGLAVWKDLLQEVASAFGFILAILLHFSLVISRLADQTKVLAQHVGRLQQRLDLVEGRVDEARLE